MDKKKALGIGVGILALGGIVYGIYKAMKHDDTHNCPTGYHWDSSQNACTPDKTNGVVVSNMPINIYYMKTLDGSGFKGWGAVPGWTTWGYNILGQTLPPLVPFLGYVVSWEVNGVPLGSIPTYGQAPVTYTCPSCGSHSMERNIVDGHKEGYICLGCGIIMTPIITEGERPIIAETPIVPTQSPEEITSIKAIISDGVHSSELLATPDDFTEDYGVIPSNIVGGQCRAYGTGKLSGKYVYHNIELTPESVFCSFKKTKFPNASWIDDGNFLYGFTIYGYGTGGLDYNVWNSTVGTLLEAYWRPMNEGETFSEWTMAGYQELLASNPTLVSFITSAGMSMACTFLYGASAIWNRETDTDGTEEHPYSADDGWQGAGYYLMLPGSQFGTAMYVSEAQKDLYF